MRAIALAQSVPPILGALRGDLVWMPIARTSVFASIVFIGISFAALMRSLMASDFTVANLVEASHSLKSISSKVAGASGSHERSLPLWVLILAAFGADVSLLGANIPDALKART